MDISISYTGVRLHLGHAGAREMRVSPKLSFLGLDGAREVVTPIALHRHPEEAAATTTGYQERARLRIRGDAVDVG